MGDEIIDCTGLNHLGQGVGRLTDGQAVFVNGLLPGESAWIHVRMKKKNYSVGEITALLRPSSDRTLPSCPVYDRCGGCSLQHCSYEAQLRYKADRVRDAFIRLGRFPTALIESMLTPHAAAAPSPSPWRYRAKAQMPLAYDTPEPTREDASFSIGFYESNSHRVVDSTDCPIQSPAADIARSSLREALKQIPLTIYQENNQLGLLRHLLVRVSSATREVMITLVVNLPERAWRLQIGTQRLGDFLDLYRALADESLSRQNYRLCAIYLNHNSKPGNVITGERYSLARLTSTDSARIDERLLGISYPLSPASFFQVNPPQTENLYREVIRLARLDGTEQVADLYCGAGSISLALARQAAAVTGIEIVPRAVEDARAAAGINGFSNVMFYCGAVETLLPQLIDSGAIDSPDVAVVDPPRKGLAPALIDCLRSVAPSRLLYVSCEPATLARDVALLCRNDYYALSEIKVFDMFPQTMHVETVVLMSRVDT